MQLPLGAFISGINRRSVFWRRFCGNFEELLLVLSGFGRWVLRCFEYLGLEVGAFFPELLLYLVFIHLLMEF